ncbi:glycoside hydrolase, partial [Pseudoxanthomonas sp. SGD-10]
MSVKNFLFIVLVFVTHSLLAQNPPKREFRGVWVATVKNIDWPSKPGLHADIQKQELINIFDEHQKNGMNAIMFQVRPSADAFYANSEELWSAFIAGEQGKGPTPFYDPLAFAIEEAHKRGMELHAWFNPYRATNDDNEKLVSPDHITHQKPEWFFTYAKKKFFNPGLPEVRSYINKIIMNVVRNYDIDGVHFDDYFYPYPGKESIPDTLTFEQHANGFTDIHDWRRNNVDLLIKEVADSIKSIKKHVKFGISPFGIWRNKKEDPRGSDTNGMSGYSALYADVLKWTEKGWIDYVNPQVYFPFGYAPAAYEVLTDWWAVNSFGRHVYI